MLVIVAALVSLACVAASARRLAFVARATSLDPEMVLAALRGDAGRAKVARFRRAVLSLEEGTWEREIVHALEPPEGEPHARDGKVASAAQVNEQLAELDWRMQRWARVPRVAASIASSCGFLLASLALRAGLESTQAVADDALGDALHGVVGTALGVAAFGMAGTVWCIALQRQALALRRTRAGAADKLVERLEAVLEAPPRGPNSGLPSEKIVG